MNLWRSTGGKAGFLVIGLVALAMLGGCVGNDVPYGMPQSNGQNINRPPIKDQAPRQPAVGEVIGSGDTRVALLLPLTAEGNASRIAAELKNAALLAMDDAGMQTLELVIKDTGGTTEGAAAAATQAVAEGSSAVLGPLFSANVRAAAPALRTTQTPMIAFSSDRAAASSGVYLNSFLPQAVVRRTLSYAEDQGVRSVVAILPEGAAGDVAEAEARRTMLETGGELTAVARYAYDNMSVYEAVQSVADALRTADAVFVPDGGSSPATIVTTMTETGIDVSSKKILGTGQWTSANLADPALQGGWFADTDQGRVDAYKQRYQTRFGTAPALTSALAYDTVVLVANIAKGGGGIPRHALETPVGFNGYAGLFRFTGDGTAERGYAIYEVREGRPQIIDAAPTRFGGGS
ncbi:penicillin-binding protein activator [uncultured Nitratireductor sp.]|uniref:penicillin-binding protein activator n=1 Tax=uncultured Nitratireductor sp. TaxID=520953 RepID=UPI0025F025DA|nr:penicillin-binding protein activator [uncultured Nitratireductor sp.]